MFGPGGSTLAARIWTTQKLHARENRSPHCFVTCRADARAPTHEQLEELPYLRAVVKEVGPLCVPTIMVYIVFEAPQASDSVISRTAGTATAEQSGQAAPHLLKPGREVGHVQTTFLISP